MRYLAVLQPQHMKGYTLVEASAKHHVEKVIGRDRDEHDAHEELQESTRRRIATRGCSPYLEPKAATAGIEEGAASLRSRVGPSEVNQRVVRVTESKEEVTVELYEALKAGCTDSQG